MVHHTFADLIGVIMSSQGGGGFSGFGVGTSLQDDNSLCVFVESIKKQVLDVSISRGGEIVVFHPGGGVEVFQGIEGFRQVIKETFQEYLVGQIDLYQKLLKKMQGS